MGNRINIPVGKRFGKLTVLEEAGRSNKCEVLWKCRCDCGRTVVVKGYALAKGSHTTCTQCPKTNNYTIKEGVAYGQVEGGDIFIVDVDDLELVKKYQWHKDNNGYIVTLVKKKNVKMHRLIMGATKGKDIDHINGLVYDNRKSNLRECTHQQNMWNMKRPSTNKTGYKGVCKLKNYDRYVAGIRVNGKQTHLGCFDDKIEAAKAYDKAAILHRGQYARINFPQDYGEGVYNGC